MRAVVIGAGLSGSFAADQLRRIFGGDLRLDVFERDHRAGGRTYWREIAGAGVETGASLIHSANRLIIGAVADLGLRIAQAGSGETLGIWDGSQMVFRTTGTLDSARLLMRYGRPMVRAAREVSRVVAKLDAVYPRLARVDAWDSPAQLWGDLDLYGLSQQSAADHFGSGRFRREFIDGVSRSNYAQDATQLNALVDLVSLAGAGLGGGRLLHVVGGNARVAEGLIRRAGAHLHMGGAVRRLRRDGILWQVSGDEFDALDADLVVLAAPHEHAGIDITGAESPPPRRFVRLHVTFVLGSLLLAPAAALPPGTVLATSRAGHLAGLGRVGDTPNGPLYKVFSTTELTDDDVARYFVATEVQRLTWLAYPELGPTSHWPDFRLAPRLYYTGAMEYAVSTMETQAIGGVTVANLAFRDQR